jgi:hypothetical protein
MDDQRIRAVVFFSSASHQDTLSGIAQPLFQRIRGVKQPGPEADHLSLFSAEVMNAWSYTPLSCVFVAWCLIVHRDIFAFTLKINDILSHSTTKIPLTSANTE